jgi:hypothetical protein
MKKRLRRFAPNYHADLFSDMVWKLAQARGRFPFQTMPASYGDMRDRDSLQSYFKTDRVYSGARIDAQTLAGIADASLDFVISAHVIESCRLVPLGTKIFSFCARSRHSRFAHGKSGDESPGNIRTTWKELASRIIPHGRDRVSENPAVVVEGWANQ